MSLPLPGREHIFPPTPCSMLEELRAQLQTWERQEDEITRRIASMRASRQAVPVDLLVQRVQSRYLKVNAKVRVMIALGDRGYLPEYGVKYTKELRELECQNHRVNAEIAASVRLLEQYVDSAQREGTAIDSTQG